MSEQPKLVFDNKPQIVTVITDLMPFTMPFTMPGSITSTRVLNPDSKVKRLVFEGLQPSLVFENTDKKLVFDILQESFFGIFDDTFDDTFG